MKELGDRQSLYLQYQEAVAATNGRDPASVRVDAMVSYDMRLRSVPTTFQLNLDNAFDRRYYTGSHPLVRD